MEEKKEFQENQSYKKEEFQDNQFYEKEDFRAKTEQEKLEKRKILQEIKHEVKTEQEKTEQQKAYNDYVKQVTPTHNLWLNMLKAFFTGGIICIIGQAILNTCENMGLDKTTSGSWCSLILILCSVLLTGFNIYPSIANWGGAGALVPITGFANGVAAPAIEFQKEGQVFGIGCKIFTIAGPVILYGIFSSWVLGLIYWALKMFQVI